MNANSEAQLALKVVFNGEVRRLKSCDLSSEQAIRMAVSHLYNITASEAQYLTMFYADDEGDMCTLTEATVPDALNLANASGKVLRLQCSQRKSPTEETQSNVPSKVPTQSDEVRAKPHLEQEISSEDLPLPMKESFAQAARTMVGEVHDHVAQQVGEMRSVATEACTAILEVSSSFQDQVVQTVDEGIVVAAGVQVQFIEASRDVSDRLSRGVAELQASSSDVRTHLSTASRRFVTRARMVTDRLRNGRSEESDVAPTSSDDACNSHDLAVHEFAEKMQVHIGDLLLGAQATAVNIRAKAKSAYDQTSEGDVKSALGVAALVTIPAVAIAIAPTRGLALVAVAAAAVGAVNLVPNASSSTDESSVQIGTANAEVHLGEEVQPGEEVRPGEEVTTCDVPQGSPVEMGAVNLEAHPKGTAVVYDVPEDDVDGWYKC